MRRLTSGDELYAWCDAACASRVMISPEGAVKGTQATVWCEHPDHRQHHSCRICSEANERTGREVHGKEKRREEKRKRARGSAVVATVVAWGTAVVQCGVGGMYTMWATDLRKQSVVALLLSTNVDAQHHGAVKIHVIPRKTPVAKAAQNSIHVLGSSAPLTYRDVAHPRAKQWCIAHVNKAVTLLLTPASQGGPLCEHRLPAKLHAPVYARTTAARFHHHP